MKWTFIIREKFKVALLLGSIMLLVGLTAIMQRSNMKDLRKSFSSIYHDRLIPATDIFYLTKDLYSKQLLIESLLYARHDLHAGPVAAELSGRNDSIVKLISKFEETFLVKDESQYLKEFKRHVLHYNQVEASILKAFFSGYIDEARQLYETQGKQDLLKTIQFLGDLTKIQSSVGQALLNNSHGIVSASDMVLTIQIILAIIIGLLTEALILASKMMDKRDPQFHLN